MQLHIPQPCHADWNEMTPDKGGRHCAQCAKTVVDFTGMSADAISVYMELHADGRVCGRFTADQLEQNFPSPQEYVQGVLRSPLPFLRRVAAMIIFALFIGASPAIAQQSQKVTHHRTMIQGAPLQQSSRSPSRVVKQKPLQHPRPKCQQPVMGKVAAPRAEKDPPPLMGDVSIAPDPQPEIIIQGSAFPWPRPIPLVEKK